MVLGISCDTPAENRRFWDKFDFPFDLLSDENRQVSLAWGAADAADTPYPARISYLIDAVGTIARVYAEVDPARHPDEVLAALD